MNRPRVRIWIAVVHQIETVIRIQSPFLFFYLKKPEKPGVSGLFRLFEYGRLRVFFSRLFCF